MFCFGLLSPIMFLEFICVVARSVGLLFSVLSSIRYSNIPQSVLSVVDGHLDCFWFMFLCCYEHSCTFFCFMYVGIGLLDMCVFSYSRYSSYLKSLYQVILPRTSDQSLYCSKSCQIWHLQSFTF